MDRAIVVSEGSGSTTSSIGLTPVQGHGNKPWQEGQWTRRWPSALECFGAVYRSRFPLWGVSSASCISSSPSLTSVSSVNPVGKSLLSP
jgi:hypothetical protein